MTEAEWLKSQDINLMLEMVRPRYSQRRLRLFAVGCCLRVWELLDAPVREAVVTAEKYADGLVTYAQLEAMNVAATLRHGSRQQELGRRNRWVTDRELAGPAIALYITLRNFKLLLPVTQCVWRLRAALAASDDRATRRRVALRQKAGEAASALEIEAQAVLFRSFFGNPFRPVTLDPAWRTSTVLALAKSIYEEKAFDRMPILADALQDAGCDDDAILDQCRDPTGVHVRGCWLVDLCLRRV
jgi:hypothetical protein